MSTTVKTPGVDPAAIAAERRYRPNPADVQRLAPNRDERLFLVLSIFIGILSGLMVVCFRVAISWIQVLTLGSSPHPGQSTAVFCAHGSWPSGRRTGAVGLPWGPGQRYQPDQSCALYLQRLHLLQDGYREIRHRGSLYRWWILARARGSFAANRGGRGFPGQPSPQSLARAAAHVWPIGAAAGLAAAFNAPISAILFVVEEVIGKWSAAVLGSIVLSAISSVVVARVFWGPAPMFRIPSITAVGPQELLAYAVLGIAGALPAHLLQCARLLPSAAGQLPRWTWYIQPPIAGLIVGAIAYFGAPQVMGPGLWRY